MKGYQVCTHAIGDRGNRETLDAYEAALKARGPTAQLAALKREAAALDLPDAFATHQLRRPPDHRFRIEHAQLLSPQDIPRFAKLSVIPSMQPTHCTSDMRWVEARVGPQRAKGAYAWSSLRKTGIPIAGGSDFPVESHNPFLGIYAAITRQDAAGKPDGGWNRQEKMTRTEALRSFTVDAAYAAFEETTRGSIATGKLADFIVVDRDILTCEPREILETKIRLTIIGGEIVHKPN